MTLDTSSQIPPGMLLRLIQEKKNIIANYELLKTMTDKKSDTEIIESILLDEGTHLSLFTSLYYDLFKDEPDLPPPELPIISSYLEGLKHAVMKELNCYTNYGHIFFQDSNAEVRNTFLRALFDENAHSTKFNFLLTLDI